MPKEISKDQFNFDTSAEHYDENLRSILGCSTRFNISIFADYKIDILKNELKGKEPKTILEFGCGIGRNIAALKKAFPNTKLKGCDVSGKSLDLAAKTFPDAVFEMIDSPQKLIDSYSGNVDFIFIANVFHHIPFAQHQDWMNALYSIPQNGGGGGIIMFEHNPYNPITRYIFSHNESDANGGGGMLYPFYASSLMRKAGFSMVNRNFTLFFLKRNRFLSVVERALFWLPLGAQYYLFADC
jgi:SAM-dependent methyltransferase